MQDESCGDAPSSGTGQGADGIYENPFKVEVRTNGRALAIGWCTPLSFQNCTSVSKSGPITWERIDIKKMKLSQPTALLVLQGIPLMRVFADGIIFSSPNSDVRGLFVLLAARVGNELWRPPPILENIVLAKVLAIPEGISKEELTTTLLASVVSPSSPSA